MRANVPDDEIVCDNVGDGDRITGGANVGVLFRGCAVDVHAHMLTNRMTITTERKSHCLCIT
jgi:hypothetical protein